MKRIELTRNSSEFQAGATIEMDDEAADKLVKRGAGKLAATQQVYSHIDEMPAAIAEEAVKALEAADLAGGYREQHARSAATASFRKK